MGCHGTWEILFLPVGEIAGKGTASVNNKDPGPLSGLHGNGSASADTNTQSSTDPAGESISRRGCGTGSRSALIVPLKVGNCGHRDRLEESGASHGQSH